MFRQIGELEVNVAGNEQVETAVPVVVAPGRSRRPVAQRDTGLFSDVGKRAIVIVVVEAIFAEVGDIDVRPAVVVEVGSPPRQILIDHC